MRERPRGVERLRLLQLGAHVRAVVGGSLRERRRGATRRPRRRTAATCRPRAPGARPRRRGRRAARAGRRTAPPPGSRQCGAADRRWSGEDADCEPAQPRLGTGAPASTDHASANSSTVRAIGPDRVEGGAEREHAVERDAPPARLQADEPAAGGRQADGAAGVRRQRRGRETGRERRRVAAGRAAGRPARMHWVLHRPVAGVLARDAPRELVQVRLADDDGARRHEALHRGRAARRHVIRVDLRAVGRADPGGVDQILDEQPRAVQRSGPRRLRLDLGDDRVPGVGHGRAVTCRA